MAQANPIAFIGEVRSELKKVVWPTRAETVRLTAVVIGVSVAVGATIGILDVIFVKLMELLVK